MAAKSELLSLSEICKRLNEKSVVIPLLQRIINGMSRGTVVAITH